MTAPGIGQYGSLTYESPESRALSTITIESYSKVYDDQGKFMSKLASDNSYMAAMMRKQQRGIDQANQNFVQQIQSMINDFIVLLGGGDFANSGLDFGDLKYVLQMLGALFGFESVGGIPVPINVFSAAWHFFSEYIFPVDNFKQVIDQIIDDAIATVLGLFGKVPVVGQALEQFAEVVSELRDALDPLLTAFNSLLSAFNVTINPDGTSDFGPLGDLWQALANLWGPLIGPPMLALAPIFKAIATWTIPFINLLTDAVNVYAAIIDLLTGAAVPTESGFPMSFPHAFSGGVLNNSIFKFFTNFLSLFNISDWLSGSFNPVTAIQNFVTEVLQQTGLLAWLNPLTGLLPDNQSPQLLSNFITSVENALQSIPGGSLLSGVIGFWADFVNSILGFGSKAVPAYTPQNSAVSNLQGQINAIQAQIAATGDGYIDPFNTPPLSSDWTPIYDVATVTDGGFVWNAGGSGPRYTCQHLTVSRPSTTLWQVQATLILPGNSGAAVFGQHRFGGGANSTLTNRFPAVECYVDQFGFRIRLVSLLGPLNSTANANNGWTLYGSEVHVENTVKSGDVLALEVDEVNKLYSVYYNPGPTSQPILQYVDTPNVFSRGVGFRDCWFQLNCLNDPFGVGNGWDNFYFFDRQTS